MSSLINAWSISGACVGAVISLASTAFSHAVSGEGGTKITIGAVIIGAGLGLGAESAYNHWTEPTPITATTCEADKPANSNMSFTIINGTPTCSYTPK